MSSLKERVYESFAQIVQDKINVLKESQDDLMESLRHETKSTAGDKYETSRAMLHIEQGNIAAQLLILTQQKAIMESIADKKNVPTETIQLGSLVHTNRGYIFIAASLGKVIIDAQSIFAISPESPLGKLLMGKTMQEQVSVQSTVYIIEAIY